MRTGESWAADTAEQQLKALWSEYVDRHEKEGPSESTKVLKAKYLSLYERYRRERNWKQLVSNN